MKTLLKTQFPYIKNAIVPILTKYNSPFPRAAALS